MVDEYASDNKHPGCPARMADGRLFTDYRPSCTLNGLYPPGARRSSYDMRQELISNGGAHLRRMRGAVHARGACTPCTPEATLVPHAAEQACGLRACGFRPASRTGLGTKRIAGGGGRETDPSLSRPRGQPPPPVVDSDLA